MNVRELVARLQQADPNAEVFVYEHGDWGWLDKVKQVEPVTELAHGVALKTDNRRASSNA